MPEKKYAILLALPIEEISLRRELSSPSHFTIQGGGGVAQTLRTDGGSTEILVSNIGLFKESALRPILS